nr:MAG TPA: hypothetical protein [Caudoviricetes sp.]
MGAFLQFFSNYLFSLLSSEFVLFSSSNPTSKIVLISIPITKPPSHTSYILSILH